MTAGFFVISSDTVRQFSVLPNTVLSVAQLHGIDGVDVMQCLGCRMAIDQVLMAPGSAQHASCCMRLTRPPDRVEKCLVHGHRSGRVFSHAPGYRKQRAVLLQDGPSLIEEWAMMRPKVLDPVPATSPCFSACDTLRSESESCKIARSIVFSASSRSTCSTPHSCFGSLVV
ncbi:hypothetical protein ACCQ05_10040 [Xanthomonas sp. NCPPB 3582]|uniref:hypothetical protein n=1 Tax=Xanthomonas sp. NCPPB 3582 TaxID=487557 RepID=UPI0035584D21